MLNEINNLGIHIFLFLIGMLDKINNLILKVKCRWTFSRVQERRSNERRSWARSKNGSETGAPLIYFLMSATKSEAQFFEERIKERQSHFTDIALSHCIVNWILIIFYELCSYDLEKFIKSPTICPRKCIWSSPHLRQ